MGDIAWWQVVNSICDDLKPHFFRRNISLGNDAPAIDDLKCMDRIRKSVNTQPEGQKTRFELVSALLTASFFFRAFGNAHALREVTSCVKAQYIVGTTPMESYGRS